MNWLKLTNTLQVISKKTRPSVHPPKIGLISPPINEPISLISTPNSAIDALYSESAVAKIWGVAKRALDRVETC